MSQESQASSATGSGLTKSTGSNEGNQSESESEEDVLHIDAGPEREEFESEANREQQGGSNKASSARAAQDGSPVEEAEAGENDGGDQRYPLMALRSAMEATHMGHTTRRGRRFFYHLNSRFPRPFMPRNLLGRGIPSNQGPEQRLQNGHGPPPVSLHIPTTSPRNRTYQSLRQEMRDRLGPPVVHRFDTEPAEENTSEDMASQFGASQATREVTPPANHVIPPEMPALELRRMIVRPNNSRETTDPVLPRVREVRLASADSAREMVVDQGPYNTPRTLTQLEEQTRSLFQAVDRRYSRFPP